MICEIICVDGFLCMLHLDIVHMLSAYVHVIQTLSGHMRIMCTLLAVVLDIFLPNRQCRCHPYVLIRYMRSGKDDKQMMCTCVDNMQMTWTMCICADNVQKLSCT